MNGDLHALRRWRRTLATAELSILIHVCAARNSGATWEKIGRALGISKQAAWRRFHEVAG